MKRELLTRMSSLPPNWHATSRTKCSRCSFMETSQTDPVTRQPLACQSLRRSFSSASLNVHVCTAAPSASSSSTTRQIDGTLKLKHSNPSSRRLSFEISTSVLAGSTCVGMRQAGRLTQCHGCPQWRELSSLGVTIYPRLSPMRPCPSLLDDTSSSCIQAIYIERGKWR